MSPIAHTSRWPDPGRLDEGSSDDTAARKDDRGHADAWLLAYNGIRFLYREVLDWPALDPGLMLPKKPQKIPVLLTRG